MIRQEEHIITLVGAGGKTSLMFALARAFRDRGEKVITTTTTRIRVPTRQQSKNLVLLDNADDYKSQVEKDLTRTGHVTLAEKRLPENKVQGIDSRVLEDIFTASSADRMIVEADGARGMSLKAPGKHEPVVPAATDLFIAMTGLDCIGQPLTDDHVFRPQLVASLTGQKSGSTITTETIARLIVHPKGMCKGCPHNSRIVIFLNKADNFLALKKARKIIKSVQGRERQTSFNWVVGSLINPNAHTLFF